MSTGELEMLRSHAIGRTVIAVDTGTFLGHKGSVRVTLNDFSIVWVVAHETGVRLASLNVPLSAERPEGEQP